MHQKSESHEINKKAKKRKQNTCRNRNTPIIEININGRTLAFTHTQAGKQPNPFRPNKEPKRKEKEGKTKR
jgi:hypothetical protein